MLEFQIQKKVEKPPRDVMEFFPFPQARESQIKAIRAIVKQFETCDNVVLEAPTGIGKSAIAITISRYYAYLDQGSFIATPLKTLQDQYQNEDAFREHIKIMKGRAAYPCQVLTKKHEVSENELYSSLKEMVSGEEEDGSKVACVDKTGEVNKKLRSKCIDENRCWFHLALTAAQGHPIVVHNFYSLVAQCRYGMFGDRDLLIADEAHNLENVILGMYQYTIRFKDLSQWFDKYPVRRPKDSDISIDSLELFLNSVLGSIEALFIEMGVDEDDVCVEEEEGLPKSLVSRLTNLKTNIINTLSDKGNWVCDRSNPNSICFKPIDTAKYAHIIKNKGDKRLFMSATILDEANFFKSMGLDENNTVALKLKSPFPIENRPIYYVSGMGKLTRDYLDSSLPRLIDKIDEIIEKYPTYKGIIHTHSYRISQEIQDRSKNRYRLIFHTSKDREEALEEFMDTPGTILVSPSMYEGIDLKDDLARFQIICKVPYPYLGDPQIKALMAKRPGWYEWKTALELVQAYGRAVRNERDWADTYILDPDFFSFYGRSKNILPKWFKDAIKRM